MRETAVTNGLGLVRLLWQGTAKQYSNLPKYAVHGRGATKLTAPVSPRIASLKRTLVLCLATILYCCSVLHAIAASVPFEGVATFDSYRACA